MNLEIEGFRGSSCTRVVKGLGIPSFVFRG